VDEQKPLSDGAVLRRARRGDEDGILDCIRRLAEYEKEPDAVQTTAEDLRQALFEPSPSVFAHVVEKGGQIDWNEPSIRFYRSIGATGMDEWTVQRLTGDALTRLAAG
jgi:hypothetical protein